MTPPLPGCVYVGCIPRCGWRVDHVVHGTRGYVGSIVLGWSRNAAPPFAWSEKNGSPPPQHGLLEHLRYGGKYGGGSCSTNPPCRRNQVLSVPLQTLPSISPVPFPLPGPPPGGPVMHRRRWQAAEISAEQPAINIASDWLTCEGRGDYLTMSAVAGHRDWRRYFWLHCCHFSAGSFELIVKKLEHRCQSRNSRWEVRWEGGLTLMSIISIQTLVWLSDRYKWDCIDTCCYSVQDNHGQANSASFTFTLHCVLANQRKCKEVYFSVSSIKTHWLFVSLKHYGPDTVCPILFRLKLFLYNAQIHSTL